MKANLYLSGFMGSGKSTVGRLLAKRLRARFVDLDSLIEREAGRPVAAIFAEKGEKAFRRLEKRLVAQTAKRTGLVVALGGGALIDRDSRRRVIESGLLVRLACSEAELWRRLKPRLSRRPLLDRSSPRANMRRLLRRRKRACPADFSVSTTDMTPARVAREIARRVIA